ncbi:peptidoglycan DD-metalloendopeptidase family protein [Candidatus Gracilibacteria bacterium]|nr:peptidoglycan DD-metalloendopeptidase family protein [Candidatus Gracilibacteria bacterium]
MLKYIHIHKWESMENFKKLTWIQYSIISIWVCNCILGSILAVRNVWIPYMNAGSDNYTQIISDVFDGTTLPIAYIPNWLKIENQDKTKRFEDISISDFIPTPLYDPLTLLDTNNNSNGAIIERYTYTTPYMGSYRLNYQENDGSHLGVDIRAPIGTPILSIANGVVIRTVEADPTGNKFVVIRHNNVPLNGENVTIYSAYLHLSQILVTEGTRIRKGEILGRVGMTGIATTPHLHFQIDTNDAPFHPYWPFTTSDSKEKGLGFYESVNAGLGQDNARKYTIHPMTFIHMYLGGTNISTTNSTMTTQPNGVQGQIRVDKVSDIQVASYISPGDITCLKKRFEDVSEKGSFGKMLYKLIDNHCIYQEGTRFEPKKAVNQREAIITLMKYSNISPTAGTSHFLDIPIGDELQGYALVAYRKGIIDGSYAFPEKILSREEFALLLSKINSTNKNPSQMRIYNDVDAMNPNFTAIQDYAFMIGAKGGKFYPKNILTRATMIQMLSNISRKVR